MKFSKFCLSFMPFYIIKMEWKMHDDILVRNSEHAMLRPNENITSYPEKAIKEVCVNRFWIPFYEDYGGNYLYRVL